MMKENLRYAGKLYLVSWLGGIAGLFVYFSILSAAKTFVEPGQPVSGGVSFAMNFIALLIQGGLFASMAYGRVWELGSKDRNDVAFGHRSKDMLRGLTIGLLASIPSFISFLALIADKAFGLWEGMAAAYRLCQVGLYPLIAWSMGPLLTVTTAELSWVSVLCAGIPTLFLPAVSMLGYILGYRHIAILERMMFVRKKK